MLDNYHAGIEVRNGWGMAWADIDNDGDLDLAARGVLYRNTLDSQDNWLQVRLVGGGGTNRAALGATVKATVNGQKVVRYVGGGGGQGCQNAQTVHFGLGAATTVDFIEVDFPGLERVRFEGPFDTGQRLWLHTDGTVQAGWRPSD